MFGVIGSLLTDWTKRSLGSSVSILFGMRFSGRINVESVEFCRKALRELKPFRIS